MSKPSPSGKLLNVLVMAGGTGGHVIPALSVAGELRRRGHGVQWLGTKKGIEASLVPRANYPLHYIEVKGLRGKGLTKWLTAPWVVLKAIVQSLNVLRKTRVDVVLGLGGFASGPGGVAAKLMGKPLVIHEQNAVAGTTNRLLSKVANGILEAFPGSLMGARHVGNPIREEIINVVSPEKRLQNRGEEIHLLVLGGSLGALAINQQLPKTLAPLLESSSVTIWHQAGKAHLDSTKTLYEQVGVSAKVVDFIDDMAAAYEWADLVVARAGALTVSELTAVGVAAVLIPYPYAIDDHQTKNAQWLSDNGAAVVKQQGELEEPSFTSLLKDLLNDREKLRSMAVNARKLALPEASLQVANACEEVCYG